MEETGKMEVEPGKRKWKSLLCFLLVLRFGDASVWDRWWSYEGINGPSFWGKANPEWKVCQYGRQQSPINIEPSRLLYDPSLKFLRIDTATISGLLMNTGHDITLEIKSQGSRPVNISEGPLSYTYRLADIKFHLSNSDSLGSEHRISGKPFPGEMHLIAYNSDLYRNVSEASRAISGLVIIAVFLEIGKDFHRTFFLISKQLRWLRFKGNMVQVSQVPLANLLPRTSEYITYEGSLTQPGCHESVTWIILNKPLIIGKEQFSDLRILFNGRAHLPELSLEINSRPLMPLNGRVVRTNIHLQNKSTLCTMETKRFYQANSRYR